MNQGDKAVEYFCNGNNCAQSVLAACNRNPEVSEAACLRIASAFGAGIARRQLTCGAVTGALMAIGLQYDKAELLSKSKILIHQFIEINGSINCKTLLKEFDINDPDDYKIMVDEKMFDTYCQKYVRDAANLLEKL